MKTSQLKKIIGSLLIVGFEGKKLTDSCRNFLEQWDLGGVILFKRNIQTIIQVATLNEQIYQAAQVRPMISVDQEGGRVFRLPPPFTVYPPMQRIAQACEKNASQDLAYRVGRSMGLELAAVGFNVDFAPVLDVNSNPENPIIGDRAFGHEAQSAVQTALAFMDGLHSTGVLGCGKHFPGHGDTTEDSHLTLPVVKKSIEELKRTEFLPFEQAVLKEIPMLMTAHVLYPALDPKWPATLSPVILTEMLQKQLKFRGLILSDDLFMKGITQKYGLEEAAEQFLRAGGDMLLLCHQEPVQRRVAAHLVHRAEQDSEFRHLIFAKSHKINQFRVRLRPAIGSKHAVPLMGELAPAHQALIKSIS